MRACTYRQKMQRSFAAELLSPYAAEDEMLNNDYSVENQKDVAEHFKVSELTIRTPLVNHGRLGREDFDGEFEVAAA
jgi:Zn-dependent peptidase ImmA (M78 family)